MTNSKGLPLGDDRPAAAVRTETGKAKRILIVDDDSDTLRLHQFLMASEGYLVETAHGAEGAMALFRSFAPDAVLLDIHMPSVDGLQLTRLIKSTKNTVPVLAVSASDAALTIVEAYNAGCDGYITKPVDTGSFASDVGEYVHFKVAS